MQEFLIEAGHEADGISRNGDFDTPLHIAVESSEAVAKLLAQRFPRCIAFRNKTGADPVRLPANSSSHSSENPLIVLCVSIVYIHAPSFFPFIYQPRKQSAISKWRVGRGE